jgi:hypothetical protein
MPLSIKKSNGQIIVKFPLGEALSLKVHRPLPVPFNIGAAINEAAWGAINIHAKKLLEGFKPVVVSAVVEGESVVVTFDSAPPQELSYVRNE